LAYAHPGMRAAVLPLLIPSQGARQAVEKELMPMAGRMIAEGSSPGEAVFQIEQALQDAFLTKGGLYRIMVKYQNLDTSDLAFLQQVIAELRTVLGV
jgi:hypothetical protein